MYTVHLYIIIAAHLYIIIASFVLFCFYLIYSSIRLFSCKCAFNKLTYLRKRFVSERLLSPVISRLP